MRRRKEEVEEVEEVEEAPFTDTTSHWSKNFVADLYAKGIVSGKTSTKAKEVCRIFSPS